jgi:hypothetical protein
MMTRLLVWREWEVIPGRIQPPHHTVPTDRELPWP